MSTEYLTKEVAANRLGISVRRLLEIAQQGTILRIKQPDEKSGQMVSLFPASEVARIRRLRQIQKKAASRSLATLQANVTLATQSTAATVPQPAAPAVRPRWLTLEQAEEYTGLPANWLLDQIRAGKLIALDVGKRPGGRWRITRQALRALESAIYYRHMPLSPVKGEDPPPPNGRQFDQPEQ